MINEAVSQKNGSEQNLESNLNISSDESQSLEFVGLIGRGSSQGSITTSQDDLQNG